jgi:hypothetical protein
MSAASPVSSGIVEVTFDRGRLSVHPQRIEIPVGGLVLWKVRSGLPEPIRVEIVFHGSPFAHTRFRLEIIPNHISHLRSGSAQEPGEYKYDVKVTTRGGAALADDDPYVIVRGDW